MLTSRLSGRDPSRPRRGIHWDREGVLDLGHAKPGRNMKRGVPGEKVIDYGAIDIREGGTAIPNDEEDLCVRREYEDTLEGTAPKAAWSPHFYARLDARG
jgi:hypothetical protein